MLIRPERPPDVDAVRALHLAAFDGPTEAALVDALRQEAAPLVSLVAADEEIVVGHILFSPVTLADHPELPLMGLAPMAVVPARQRQGIGAALIGKGIERCRDLGAAGVIVLGHAEYYPRFGFVPARPAFGITSEYDVPDDNFMALELHSGALAGKSGLLRYHPVFNTV